MQKIFRRFIVVTAVFSLTHSVQAETTSELFNEVSGAVKTMNQDTMATYKTCKTIRAKIPKAEGTEAHAWLVDGMAAFCIAETMFIKQFRDERGEACDYLFTWGKRLKQLIKAKKVLDFAKPELATAKKIAAQQSCKQDFKSL